ncbi:MAG: flavodoxin family protein [Acidimicrobiales bacterium]
MSQPSAGPLLVVRHSRSGSTDRLVEAFGAGVQIATEQIEDAPRLEVKGCFEAGPDDVLGAAAVVLATPANFGYMSGAMKDFFERIFHACLDQTVGRPYALIIKGDTDTSGAVTSVERIVAGLQWKAVLAHLSVVGDITDAHLAAAAEMGSTLTAGLAEGLF